MRNGSTTSPHFEPSSTATMSGARMRTSAVSGKAKTATAATHRRYAFAISSRSVWICAMAGNMTSSSTCPTKIAGIAISL